MVFVFLEGYAFGAPSYTTCPDANPMDGAQREVVFRGADDRRRWSAPSDLPARHDPVRAHHERIRIGCLI